MSGELQKKNVTKKKLRRSKKMTAGGRGEGGRKMALLREKKEMFREAYATS
jgi:hypothetical protein